LDGGTDDEFLEALAANELPALEGRKIPELESH
jgi:hypothetical protein